MSCISRSTAQRRPPACDPVDSGQQLLVLVADEQLGPDAARLADSLGGGEGAGTRLARKA
jgi:hypothetical protein